LSERTESAVSSTSVDSLGGEAAARNIVGGCGTWSIEEGETKNGVLGGAASGGIAAANMPRCGHFLEAIRQSAASHWSRRGQDPSPPGRSPAAHHTRATFGQLAKVGGESEADAPLDFAGRLGLARPLL